MSCHVMSWHAKPIEWELLRQFGIEVHSQDEFRNSDISCCACTLSSVSVQEACMCLHDQVAAQHRAWATQFEGFLQA